MPPTLTAEDGTETALVEHRGKLLQIFQAPWTRLLARGGSRSELHLHVQEVGGANSAGQILPLDHPLAQELAQFHPEVEGLKPTQASLDAIAGQGSQPGYVPAAAPAEFDYAKLAAEITRQQATALPNAAPALDYTPARELSAPGYFTPPAPPEVPAAE